MTFRCQMQHDVRIKIGESDIHLLALCDIGLHKMVARGGYNLRNSVQASGVCQLIDGEHVVVVVHGTAYDCGANEPRASGHHQSHPSSRLLLRWPDLLSIATVDAGGN
jgi:hypothetical protein